MLQRYLGNNPKTKLVIIWLEFPGYIPKTPYEKKSKQSLQIQRKKSSKPLKSPIDRILFLQRTIGNQAVQRLIKSGPFRQSLR